MLLPEIKQTAVKVDLTSNDAIQLFVHRFSNRFKLQEGYALDLTISLDKFAPTEEEEPSWFIRRQQTNEFASLYNQPQINLFREGNELTVQLTYYTTSYTYVQNALTALDTADLAELTQGTFRGKTSEELWDEEDEIIRTETENIRSVTVSLTDQSYSQAVLESLSLLLLDPDADVPSSTVLSMEVQKTIPNRDYIDASMQFYTTAIEEQLQELGLKLPPELITLRPVKAVVKEPVEGRYNLATRRLTVRGSFDTDKTAIGLYDRVLLLHQKRESENGLYYVAQAKNLINDRPWILQRIEEIDPTAPVENDFLFKVERGELYANSYWRVNGERKRLDQDEFVFTQLISSMEQKMRFGLLALARAGGLVVPEFDDFNPKHPIQIVDNPEAQKPMLLRID